MVMSSKFINMHDPHPNNFCVRICTIYALNYRGIHVNILLFVEKNGQNPHRHYSTHV